MGIQAAPTPKELSAELAGLRGTLALHLEEHRRTLVQAWANELRRVLSLPSATGLPDPANQALSYKELDRLFQQLVVAIKNGDFAGLAEAAAANHHEPMELADSSVRLVAKLSIFGDVLRRSIMEDASVPTVETLYLLDRILTKLTAEAVLIFAERRRTAFDRITQHSRSLKETLQAILDSSPVGILVTDREGVITYFNQEQERVSGVSRDQALGQTLYAGYAGRAADDSRAAFRRALDEGATTALPRRSYDGRQGTQILDVQMGPIRDAHGKITGTVHVCRDVSDLSQLEGQLLERNKELANKVRELEEAYTYIGKVNRQFASLIDVNSTLGTSLALDKVLDFIVRSAAMLTRAKLVTLRQLDGTRLNLIAQFGFTPEEAQHYRVVHVDQSIIGRVIRENRQILVVDLTAGDAHFQWPELVQKYHLKSLVSVPLHSRGRIVGVISIHLPEARQFSNLELNFLIALANQAALAIDLERTLRAHRPPKPQAQTLPPVPAPVRMPVPQRG